MPGINETFKTVNPGDPISASEWNRGMQAISRLARRKSSGKKHVIMLGTGVEEIEGEEEGLDFYFGGAEAMPAYGIGVITDSFSIDDDVIPKVTRPTMYGCQENFLVNDQEACDASSRGVGQFGAGGYYKILYDSADGTPLKNQRWGPRNGTYKLKKQTLGFRVIGVCDPDNFIVLVRAEPMWWFRGQPTADIASNGSGTVTIFYNGTTTGVTQASVLNDSSCTVKANQNVRVLYNPDAEENNPWQITDGHTA